MSERIVALEEHISFRRFTGEVDPQAAARRGYAPGRGAGARGDDLDETEGRRIELMDEAGITLQVLSVVGPGADIMPPDAAPSFAQRYNDEIARAVQRRPDRFSAFAHLPLGAPEAAADELERCVRTHGFLGALINGTTDGRFLDDARFAPLLERAQALDVPLYLHPGIPPEAVRRAYYDVADEGTNFVFANSGWGWHAETAVHVLRLVLSGALDRYPRLRLIIGHMGEGLPAMLGRCDATFGRVAKHLQRSVSETILDQVVITISGFFYEAPFLAALLTFGADRILFSVDYPFAENRDARDFLDRLPLAPSDKAKIAHANADRVLKLAR
jgi:predicted TIM-barrel fold metal-dependent hydrolase